MHKTSIYVNCYESDKSSGLSNIIQRSYYSAILTSDDVDGIIKILLENKYPEFIMNFILTKYPHIIEYYFEYDLVEILKSNIITHRCKELRWHPTLKKLGMNKLKLHRLHQLNLSKDIIEKIEEYLYY